MANEDRAVVIGGSMGGVLAARVLSERYERVTVLERDALPEAGLPRKGVPQARHAHALLERGRRVLDELFPGLTEELADAGAVVGDLSEDTGWFHEGGYHARHRSGIRGLLVSRPLLDGLVLRRLRSIPNVEVVERCDVLGLEVERGRVRGVRLQRRAAGTAVERLRADLTVDATGRGSRTPAWLEAAGFEPPAVDEVHVDIEYATRVLRRRPDQLGGRRAVVIASTPGAPRAGVALAMEGDRWIVSLGGYLGDRAPSGDGGLDAFARGLPSPDIAALLAQAEPVSEVLRHRFPASLRRRYERLRRFPDGRLVVGDAICSFNPLYGQGMSVAALEAIALRECLARGADRDLARRFFRRVAPIVDGAWTVAVAGDLRLPRIAGRRSAMLRFMNWYLARLHLAAQVDPLVSDAFLRVANLLAPPASVLRPAVVARVLRAHLARRAAAPAATAEHADASPGRTSAA